MTTDEVATDQVVPGDLVELTVGPVAHGGHCVARLDGRVVFVRHALPGEVVKARITDAGRESFYRADAETILSASPDRVPSVWPQAGPGGVGGAELGHVKLAAQRSWKASVLHEQLQRLAGLNVDVELVPAPHDEVRQGLGWRTRINLVADANGQIGMLRHRSHDVVPLEAMPLATMAVMDMLARERVFARSWKPGTKIEAVVPGSGIGGLLLVEGIPWRHGRVDRRPNARRSVQELVTIGRKEFEFRVAAAGFWQVHDQAPAMLAAAVLEELSSRRSLVGAHLMDLYSGAGLFSVILADAVGASGAVHAVEGSAQAVRDARRNAFQLPQVTLHQGRVDQVMREHANGVLGYADAVVLDPPRTGAGRDVVDLIATTGTPLVVYVACDPAALARDVASFRERGFSLDSVRGFDIFPHTHHAEYVATLSR